MLCGFIRHCETFIFYFHFVVYVLFTFAFIFAYIHAFKSTVFSSMHDNISLLRSKGLKKAFTSKEAHAPVFTLVLKV